VHGQQGAADKRVGAIAALAEGLGIRTGARGCAVAPHPVRGWRVDAAEHWEAFARSHLRALHVEPGQKDARCAWLRAVKAGEGTASEASKCLSRAPPGVWGAMAPGCQLRWAGAVGERPLALAPRLGPRVPPGWAPDGAPRLRTAGWRASRTALVTLCGRGRQPARRQATGPRPKPRGRPWPPRLSAPGVQSSRRWRLGRGQHRLIVGAAEPSEASRGQRGGKMHTRVVERRQLDLRQPGAALGRRVTTFCQPEAGWRQPVTLVQASHHFVWPQARVRLPVLATTAIQRWRPGVPSGAGV
jgi:hypothetical protein